jgi:hypothetical protein
MKVVKPCPACGVPGATVFLSVEVPVNCSALFACRDEARRADKGPIALACCELCGMIFNAVFEPGLLVYDGSYENSLHFSPAFQAYCTGLVQRLVETYDLREKTIVEVGCGGGEFLAQLCEVGHNSGLGFDPSFRGDAPSPRVRIVPLAYSGDQLDCKAGAICCRHVLEHIPEPDVFLRGISSTLTDSPESVFYCETPNAADVLGGSSLWDIIYPHCSYFTAVSMRRVLERARFKVLYIGSAFGGQFLAAEAVAGGSNGGQTLTAAAADELAAVRILVQSFAGRLLDTIDRWAAAIESSRQQGRRLALWGAGAKAVTFLNMVPGAECIDTVVDLNPRKHGMFVPCTGQRIVGPVSLMEYQPDTVILLNPAYQAEVSQALADVAPGAKMWMNAGGTPAAVN